VPLEIDKIALFPTSWILNHPIDEESVLYGRSVEEIKRMDLEIYVLLKGFDDVFSQTILQPAFVPGRGFYLRR